jgi:DNA-binding MarR family transcriptional regulator
MWGVKMMPIRMTRTVKGKDKIKELEKKYKKKENLKMISMSSIGTSLDKTDLEDWEYFQSHPEEKLKEGLTVFIEDLSFNVSDFEMLHTIKHNKVSSLNELAFKLNKEISTVNKQLNLSD